MPRSVLVVAFLLALALVAGLVLLFSGGPSSPPAPPPAPATRALIEARAPAAPERDPESGPGEDPGPNPVPAPEASVEPPLRVLTNVPGAEVKAWFRTRGDGDGPPAVETVTGENGEAAILLPVRREDLQAAHVTVAARGWSTVKAESKGEDLRLELKPGFEVSGRVSFPDGRPVPGVRIQANNVMLSTDTDPDGNYVLGGLPEGKADVWFIAGNENRSVDAGAAGVDFVLRQNLVRFRVVDAAGEPVEECGYSYRGLRDGEDCMGGAGSSGDGGKAIDVEVPSGVLLQFTVDAPGIPGVLTEVSFEGDPRLHEIEVVLRPPRTLGRIRLQVRDDQGSAPGEIVLTVTNAGDALLEGYYRKKVPLDAEGETVIEGVPPGAWTVEVASRRGVVPEGFGIPAVKSVRVEGDAESRLDFLIRSGGRLLVTVRDGSGTVVPAGDIRLLDDGGKHCSVLFWTRKGEGWSTGLGQPAPAHAGDALLPGRYTVQILDAERVVRASKEVVIPYRETVEVEIRLPE